MPFSGRSDAGASQRAGLPPGPGVPADQRDEAYGYDLTWRHTFLVHAAERGSLDNRLVQISGNEAARLVALIRRDAWTRASVG